MVPAEADLNNLTSNATQFESENNSLSVKYDKHFMFLDLSDDGHMLLGAGNLGGRHWSSSIHYYKEAKTSINQEYGQPVKGMNDVISCGKILESGKRIVLGDDNGMICLSSIEVTDDSDNFNLGEIEAALDHDSNVLALSLSPNKNNLVSGGKDCCIKVWDVAVSLKTLFTYRPAHSHIVSHVEYSPKSDDIFLSCSHDGSAILWDTRALTQPALELKYACNESLSAGCWLKENVVAVGSSFGNIMLIDIRMKHTFGHTKCFDRPLHKIVSNSNGIIAACGDTSEVKAFDTPSEYLKQIYTSDSHKDFVRGLAWHPKTSQLYSCGFDTTVICHDIIKS
ncbi:methylosome protein 50 [Nilaparvata lugens]|uniref:methylosome protein 50 n=1 Tax=Nilaparvata lugens TaxID=108931 RepID=UPI00193D492A|nr:methylosome protein 50 [Nilaparvata lugens]